MKICVAQTKPVTGNIEKNIANHQKLIDRAISHGADTIIFPELSLTGYEPELAAGLATNSYDSRLDVFHQIRNLNQITIGVGMPINTDDGVSIGMVLFQPGKDRQTYFKKYLHADEEPYFVSQSNTIGLIGYEENIALSICYEISVAKHAEEAACHGAKFYIASVAKFNNGIENALHRLADIAKKYSMTVLMSNCIGTSDGQQCAGKSSIWNDEGYLIGQLDDISEGLLLIDTQTKEVIQEKTG